MIGGLAYALYVPMMVIVRVPLVLLLLLVVVVVVVIAAANDTTITTSFPKPRILAVQVRVGYPRVWGGGQPHQPRLLTYHRHQHQHSRLCCRCCRCCRCCCCSRCSRCRCNCCCFVIVICLYRPILMMRPLTLVPCTRQRVICKGT